MRLAQITDLHLRHHLPGTAAAITRRSRAMPDLLAEALRQARDAGADAVAITGDLLDVPDWVMSPVPGFIMDRPEWWRQAAVRDYRLVRDLLESVGLPWFVLPGNHDDDQAMWQVFDPADHGRDLAGFRIARFCDYEHDCHVARRFIPARARWNDLLADAASPPQIHLQHYVITPTLNEGYPHTYAEADSLLSGIIASQRVRLCLSGHYHAGTDLLRHGDTWFSTGPAFCTWPHPWRMYELAGDQVTMTEHTAGTQRQRRPVVFLDRDGVINDLAAFNAGPERMALVPGSAQGIADLQRAGYAVVGVSAQSGVGVGNVPKRVVDATNDSMHRQLAEGGAAVDAVYYSMGGGDRAVLPQFRSLDDAKPRPTLLHRAAEELHLDLQGAWMVGDRLTDVQTGVNAGIQPVLVLTGYGPRYEQAVLEAHPGTPIVADLAAAAKLILSRSAVTNR